MSQDRIEQIQAARENVERYLKDLSDLALGRDDPILLEIANGFMDALTDLCLLEFRRIVEDGV